LLFVFSRANPKIKTKMMGKTISNNAAIGCLFWRVKFFQHNSLNFTSDIFTSSDDELLRMIHIFSENVCLLFVGVNFRGALTYDKRLCSVG
jgi:hypothetical protein